MTPREKDIVLLQRAAGGFERVKVARAIWGAQDVFIKRYHALCIREEGGIKIPVSLWMPD